MSISAFFSKTAIKLKSMKPEPQKMDQYLVRNEEMPDAFVILFRSGK